MTGRDHYSCDVKEGDHNKGKEVLKVGQEFRLDLLAYYLLRLGA